MYQKFCNKQNLFYQVLEIKAAPPGLRQATLKISGKQVSKLADEGGTHRIQHKTKSRKKDRIHTSTATIAVMPWVEKQNIQLDNNQLKVETMRGSGPGGQHRNKTDSTVRITHLPSGLSATIDGRSQARNRELAKQLLAVRVNQQFQQQQFNQQQQIRSQQTIADRATAIRTYDLIEDNVRGKRKVRGAKKILNGQLERLLD
jgi:peptide chain release factor 1